MSLAFTTIRLLFNTYFIYTILFFLNFKAHDSETMHLHAQEHPMLLYHNYLYLIICPTYSAVIMITVSYAQDFKGLFKERAL